MLPSYPELISAEVNGSDPLLVMVTCCVTVAEQNVPETPAGLPTPSSIVFPGPAWSTPSKTVTPVFPGSSQLLKREELAPPPVHAVKNLDRKSTRLNSNHNSIS